MVSCVGRVQPADLIAFNRSASTELTMDILKYGADVEVRALDALRAAVISQINSMRAMYEK